MELDDIDVEILAVVAEQTLWKNKIHERLPVECSVQVVGRRVDALVEDGYLAQTIIAPDELPRDLIIAFKLTENGEAALVREEQGECSE